MWHQVRRSVLIHRSSSSQLEAPQRLNFPAAPKLGSLGGSAGPPPGMCQCHLPRDCGVWGVGVLSRLGWSHTHPTPGESLQQTSFSVFSLCSGGVMIYFDRIEVVNFLIQSAGESRVVPQPRPGGCAAAPGGAEAVPWEPGCPTGVPRAPGRALSLGCPL